MSLALSLIRQTQDWHRLNLALGSANFGRFRLSVSGYLETLKSASVQLALLSLRRSRASRSRAQPGHQMLPVGPIAIEV